MKIGRWSQCNSPTMPACFARRTSSGVSSGDKYRVMRNVTSGASFSSCALYVRACFVVVMGGLRLGCKFRRQDERRS